MTNEDLARIAKRDSLILTITAKLFDLSIAKWDKHPLFPRESSDSYELYLDNKIMKLQEEIKNLQDELKQLEEREEEC